MLVFNQSACSTTSNEANKISQVKYEYPHKCTFKGKPVTHFITAKVPLTTDELQRLKPTLEENFQLDFDSCVLLADGAKY
jgi:hypothetical protein